MSRPAERPTGGTRRSSRPARVALVLAICAVSTALLLGAADPLEPDNPPLPRQVMDELRAANVARTQLLDEEQEWAMEAERLELLLATINDETARLGREADQAVAARTVLDKQVSRLQSRRERLDDVEATVDTLCERLEKALDHLASRSLPGLVPPDRAAGITRPDERLAAAVSRLDDTERRAARAGIEIVQGDLDDRGVTIKLLRLGSVAAWWTALDGRAVGTAEMAGGKLVLGRTDAPQEVAAIATAFAIVEGRAAPDWILLPVANDVVNSAGGDQP